MGGAAGVFANRALHLSARPRRVHAVAAVEGAIAPHERTVLLYLGDAIAALAAGYTALPCGPA